MKIHGPLFPLGMTKQPEQQQEGRPDAGPQVTHSSHTGPTPAELGDRKTATDGLDNGLPSLPWGNPLCTLPAKSMMDKLGATISPTCILLHTREIQG